MRSNWLRGTCIGIATLWPAAASACDFFLAYGPMGMQTTTVAVGAAVHVTSTDIIVLPESDPRMGFVSSLDVGVRLRDRAVIHPAVGYCSWADTDEFIAGGALGVSLLRNDAVSLGVQSHLAWVDYGEVSNVHIPVMVAAAFGMGETGSLHLNVGVRVVRFSAGWDGQPDPTRSTDPAVSAGITLPVGSTRLFGGIVVARNGEDRRQTGGAIGYETDYSFGGGLQFPLGG